MGCAAGWCRSYQRALSVVEDVSLLLQRWWKETRVLPLSLSFFKVCILSQHLQFSFPSTSRSIVLNQPGKPALHCLHSWKAAAGEFTHGSAVPHCWGWRTEQMCTPSTLLLYAYRIKLRPPQSGRWLVLSLLGNDWHRIHPLELKDAPRTKRWLLQHSTGPRWPAQPHPVTGHHWVPLTRLLPEMAVFHLFRNPCPTEWPYPKSTCFIYPEGTVAFGLWEPRHTSVSDFSQPVSCCSFLEVRGCLRQELRLQQRLAAWLLQIASHHSLCL